MQSFKSWESVKSLNGGKLKSRFKRVLMRQSCLLKLQAYILAFKENRAWNKPFRQTLKKKRFTRWKSFLRTGEKQRSNIIVFVQCCVSLQITLDFKHGLNGRFKKPSVATPQYCVCTAQRALWMQYKKIQWHWILIQLCLD